MQHNIKNNSFLNLIVNASKKLKWVEVFGIVIFFFIILVTFLFLTRKKSDVIVTVRLLQSNSAPAWYNFPRQIFLEKIKKGLKEKGQLGGTVVEVLDVYKYPSSDVNQDVFVTIKIRSIYNKQTGQYSYDNLPLLIGDYRTFHLQDVVFSGLVTDIGTSDKPRSQKKFLITGYLNPVNNNDLGPGQQVAIFNGINTDGVKNYLADQVKLGIKILDSNGQTVAEIVSVKKAPGKITTIQNGHFATADDPDTKYVEITLNVLADKIGDSYFFQKEQSLRVGGYIILSFENLKITPTMTSVTEAN